jgi:hypothetical protein
MNLSFALEHVEGNGYRATALVPPIVAEAPSRDEAVNKLRAMIREKLSTAELIQIEVPDPGRPSVWLEIAGTWRDHPDIDEVEDNIKTYRQQVNANSDRL